MNQLEEKTAPRAGSPQVEPPPLTKNAPPHEHHISRGKLFLVALILIAIVVGAALAGYLPRREREAQAAAAAREERVDIPTVTAAVIRRASADTELMLPGSILPLIEASIYARATGYVRKRYVDIGDHVRARQLMADIDTPDLDQQVAQAQAAVSQAKQQFGQAQAALAQAQAQQQLAKATWDRYRSLVELGAVARQDADTQETAFRTAGAIVTAQEANVHAAQDAVKQAQANLDRLVTLQQYQKVRAPFTGIVTARNVDVGYLISAAGSSQGVSPMQLSGTQTAGTAGNEMFRVAQIGTLRILVSVPQASAPGIHFGMPAEITVAEFPGRIFPGKVTRTTNSLDPNSRTMLVEVQAPNSDGKLLPGMYANVRFRDHRNAPPLLIPGDALIVSANGLQVATLVDAPEHSDAQGNADNKTKRIHLLAVQVGRDYGAETEILSGAREGQLVVLNPGDEVREGALVRYELSGSPRGNGAQPAGAAGQSRNPGVTRQ